MRRDERLRYCKICMHRKMDLNQGLICGLTGRPASFEGNCKDFDRDEVQANKIVKRVYEKREVKSESTSPWSYIVGILVLIKLFLILIKLMR